MDRIRTVHITRSFFKASSHAGLSDLIFRMVYESDVMPACVRFDRKTIPFVGDQKYYYGFVEEKKLGLQIEMHFLTVSYDMLAHWLLGFVDTVEVVSPEPLKEIMAEHVKRFFVQYNYCVRLYLSATGVPSRPRIGVIQTKHPHINAFESFTGHIQMVNMKHRAMKKNQITTDVTSVSNR